MSTSDGDANRDGALIPSELLSVESLTRLANEFFQSDGLPAETAGPNVQSTAGSPIGTGGTGVAGVPADTGVFEEAVGTSVSPALLGSAANAPSNAGSPVPSSLTGPALGGVAGESFDPSDLGLSADLLRLPSVDGAASDPAFDVDVADSAQPIDGLDRLASAAVAELPTADFIIDRASKRPASTEDAVDDALGDHPYLEGEFDKGLAELDLSGFPAGGDFTGHDPSVLDGIPGFTETVALTDQFADATALDSAFDAVIPNELVQDEYASSVSLTSPNSSTDGVKDLGREVGQPVSGQGESGYVPDEVVSNSALPLGRISLDDDAARDVEPTSSSASAPSAAEFSPTVVPAVPVKEDIFDAERIREDFPILREQVHGHRIAWLDNGATTQKPQSVIDRISYFYEHENSNVHRTAHTLAGRATDAYEGAREKIRRFLNASSTDEIIYVRGATEGMNLLANTFGEQNVGEGDEVLISWLEHHANIVPWQMLCARKGAKLKVAPVDDSGQIILSEYERLITPRTKLISFTQVSNALGTITPAAEMIEIAHRHGVQVVLDGAQGVLHMRVDVQKLDPDFYVFSGHKMFGPTGIGAVYGKMEHLAKMPPWQGGGNMIDCVQFDRTTYQDPPWRFEAGTGNIADAVGLGAAIDYINSVGIENIAAHEHELLEYGTAGLLTVPGLRLIGTADNKAAVMSFVLAGHEPEEVGAYLDRQGIAVRAGHHCAQPILRRFGVNATVRPSLALYNTKEDLDRLVDALCRLQSGSN